jgi:hypothetical protein
MSDVHLSISAPVTLKCRSHYSDDFNKIVVFRKDILLCLTDLKIRQI